MFDLVKSLPLDLDNELEDICRGWPIDPTPRVRCVGEYYPHKNVMSSEERQAKWEAEYEARCAERIAARLLRESFPPPYHRLKPCTKNLFWTAPCKS